MRGERKVTTSCRVTPEVKGYLDQCESASEEIETALRGSKRFREWRRNRD